MIAEKSWNTASRVVLAPVGFEAWQGGIDSVPTGERAPNRCRLSLAKVRTLPHLNARKAMASDAMVVAAASTRAQISEAVVLLSGFSGTVMIAPETISGVL